MSHNFLIQMKKDSHRRVELSQQLCPLVELERDIQSMSPCKELAFQQEQVGVIAEFKRRSPSKGELTKATNLAKQIQRYDKADALSILTQPSHFGGSLEDLKIARHESDKPILRKDFIVAPYQVFETRAAGADGILLIMALLEDSELTELIQVARDLGMFALVETSSRSDIERALSIGARIIGINARDLRNLGIDERRFEQLRPIIPSNVTAIAESSIRTPSEMQQIAELEFDAALIGTELMQSSDPAQRMEDLRKAGQRKVFL